MKPDSRKTTYTKLQTETMAAPKVIFGTTALKWVRALVDGHTTEVGFYAVVDDRSEGEVREYFVRDVFYPKHSEMNGATCEISPEGEHDMMIWLLDHDREADVAKVRFWGHSHCNMGTSPSGQDETQALERMAQTQAFLIRAIAAKSGEMSVSFFDFDAQIRFDNIDWEAEDDASADVVEGKLSRIQEILNDGEVAQSDKLLDIARTTMSDDLMDDIVDKVKELKEKNEPKKVVTQVGRGGQTSLFPGHGHGHPGPHSYNRGDEETHFGQQFGGPFPQGDLIPDEEVDSMLEEWNETYATGNGGK